MATPTSGDTLSQQPEPRRGLAPVGEVVGTVEGLGVVTWLRGGWAVDALVGEQTRPHTDVDLAVVTPDLHAVARQLTERGWIMLTEGPVETETGAGGLTLRTPEGMVVELHQAGGPPYDRALDAPAQRQLPLAGHQVRVPAPDQLLAEVASRHVDENTLHDLLQLARVAPAAGGPIAREDDVELVSVPVPMPPRRNDILLFAARRHGQRVGAGLLARVGDEGRIAVSVEPAARRAGVGTTVARALTRYAFATLGLRRVVARHRLGDFPAERLGVRAGFRREGVARSADVPGGRADVAVLARLPGDADPTRDTLLAHLSTVAAARLAASLLIRDSLGRVLLVEPTYKPGWDLPGGSVEAGESPREAARREGQEELGVEIPVAALLAVDWLGGPAGHGDGLFFLFDGGVVEDVARFMAQLRLPADELRAARFVEPDTAAGMLTPSLATRLTSALRALQSGVTAYLEFGVPALEPPVQRDRESNPADGQVEQT
jgi:ADP-ribose pyrophosphatase YjhB (NUDIX family)/ribosomal protein S18 acetylase RimI-like enzyme